jgi:hypothetical protein
MNPNYFEFYPCSAAHFAMKCYEDDEVEIYKADPDRSREFYYATFNKALSLISPKPTTKTFRQFTKDEVVYTSSSQSGEILVYSLTPLYKVSDLNAIAYEKKKLSIINMQSSTDYDDLANVSRTTFRVSNRVYLNCEIYQYNDDATCDHRVYVNYNHDPKVDWAVIEKDLNRALAVLSTNMDTIY